MTTKVQQWGNSLAIRIPASFAKDVRLTKGTVVDLSVLDGQLVIDPAIKPKYSLSVLLKGISRTNKHPETHPGRAVGREVW